ncbi:MAG TPA: ROK family transcriptional regulator [Solirubrobacteraceae bacterium]|jgi:predicted NBD/HSP70 family sugar kinase
MTRRPSPPANQRAVRRHNLGVVLRHVVARGPRSRATIALETGLNKSTVSSLVTELIELGLLSERGAERTGVVGRPGLVVELAGEGAVGLGLEVGVDYLAVHATDLTGAVRHHRQDARDNRGRPAEEVLDRLGALARDALAGLHADGLRPAGVTVALPGLVDVASGTLLVAPNLHWEDFPAVAAVAERLGEPLPVSADNEANLSALAERWDGAGRDVHDFLHVSGEVGVGAGIVLGGELFRGTRGFGGELGHVTVDPDGRECACGSRGCLETKVGLEALVAAAGARDPRDLLARARAGDAAVVAALRDGGRWLGIGAAGVANLLDLQAVVLGGYFATLAEWMQAGVVEELHARVLGPSWAVPRVIASDLGPEAAVRGAAAQVLHVVLANPAALGEAPPVAASAR